MDHYEHPYNTQWIGVEMPGVTYLCPGTAADTCSLKCLLSHFADSTLIITRRVVWWPFIRVSVRGSTVYGTQGI